MILKSHNIMNQNGIFFFYSGYITQNILLSLNDAIKEKIADKNIDSTTSKKIFSVFAELSKNVLQCTVENLTKADKKHKNQMCRGIIVIGEENGKFYISCGCIISKDSKQKLQMILDKIRKMSKEQLNLANKEIEKETTNNTIPTEAGLLEVAKSASEPISYEFKENDEDTNFFFLQTIVE